jgi:hypothetical protein
MQDDSAKFVDNDAKRYWRDPRFYMDLILAQAVAFSLTCVLTMFCLGCAEAAGVSRDYIGLIPKLVGFGSNVPLAIIGFRLARSRALNRLQPRGFPVVMSSETIVIVDEQNRFDVR